MTFVLDASATVPWFLADEASQTALARLKRVQAEGAIVPSLWHLEVGNVLLNAQRRGRLSEDALAIARADLPGLRIRVDAETDQRALNDTFDLAVRFRLTLYDAAYLELANRLRLPLATDDQALIKAAQTLGIPLV